jgi:AcrR family transcriptional regulator
VSEGLRERKKAETRRALSSAALRLADELGPDGVTVEAIAEAAGVSPRTFFNYFSTKEDAIVGITPAQPSDLLTGLIARPTDESPLAAMRATIHESAARIEAGADDWAMRTRLFQRHPNLAGRHAARFAEVERGMVEEVARRSGLDADLDIYPALLVATVMGAVRVAMAVWQAQDKPGALAEPLDAAFDQLTAGLDVPEPTRRPILT